MACAAASACPSPNDHLEDRLRLHVSVRLSRSKPVDVAGVAQEDQVGRSRRGSAMPEFPGEIPFVDGEHVLQAPRQPRYTA
jgi:hypothetical protein